MSGAKIIGLIAGALGILISILWIIEYLKPCACKENTTDTNGGTSEQDNIDNAQEEELESSLNV